MIEAMVDAAEHPAQGFRVVEVPEVHGASLKGDAKPLT
jgi:hypothetical protein